MIATQYLTEWASSYPWKLSEQVEQDLLISRAVVAIYSDPFLAERLAWRGGTALYKLYLKPQPRYSEDIDTVLRCWRRYKKELGEELPSWREFVLNVEAKLRDDEYRHGMDALLRPEVSFDPDSAWRLMRERIVDRLMTADDAICLRISTAACKT